MIDNAEKEKTIKKPKKQYCSVKSEKRKDKKAFPIAVGFSMIVSAIVLLILALI